MKSFVEEAACGRISTDKGTAYMCNWEEQMIQNNKSKARRDRIA